MSSATMPPHDFVTVRGRGYRPEQVEAYLEALSQDRDAAWERAARLTVLAKDMGAEAARMRDVVSRLTPQEYETLGEGARSLFQFVLEEAADLRERTRRAAREQVAQAEADAEDLLQEARKAADALCADADDRARRLLLAAGAEAEDLRVGARREVKERRGQALAAVREARQATAAMLAEQSREHAERWALAERQDTADLETLDPALAERVGRAERELAEAEREFAEAEEYASRAQEEAEARAAEIVADARVREENVVRETEQVLCEHREMWDDVRAHMDNVRSSLISLTGRPAME
ncbi:cellulose-binding protein [Streptomyces sp. NPDC040750]|uniref:cellulose-binding protein n=1 Tax=Streptomyces sp. NPDC040750 TaxID=3154491 RepID=UPI0033C245B2